MKKLSIVYKSSNSNESLENKKWFRFIKVLFSICVFIVFTVTICIFIDQGFEKETITDTSNAYATCQDTVWPSFELTPSEKAFLSNIYPLMYFEKYSQSDNRLVEICYEQAYNEPAARGSWLEMFRQSHGSVYTIRGVKTHEEYVHLYRDIGNIILTFIIELVVLLIVRSLALYIFGSRKALF